MYKDDEASEEKNILQWKHLDPLQIFQQKCGNQKIHVKSLGVQIST